MEKGFQQNKNGDYGLVDENVGNENEVEQEEFTFPTHPIPGGNEYMQNDGMSSFMSSYDQSSNPLINFGSMSESFQGSDLLNYRGGTGLMSLDSDHMYQDLALIPQSISRQGSQLPYYQDNLLAHVVQTQPLSQGSNLFSQQSNLLTNFAFNPQSSNQGTDVSYWNSLTDFDSTTSQSFNQELSNPSYYQDNLSRNFNSTPQPWNHQGLNLQYPQPNLVTDNFPSLLPPLTQEYEPSYQANLTTSFFSTPQPLGQVPDLSYHQDNSTTNLSFNPQLLNQGSSPLRINYDNPSSNFTFTPQPLNQGSSFLPLNHDNPSGNLIITPQSLNQWSLNHNNPSFNLTFTPQPLSQGSSWRHLNHDTPSTNFSFTPQPLNEGYSLPPQNYDNPLTNFTFTSQPLNQESSVLSLNHDFNNPNENLLGFPNERDDYSFNYPLAQGGQQSFQHGEAVGATSVPFSYNPTDVQQNPNMVQPSPVIPQNNNYNFSLKTTMGAPTNTVVTTAPPQPPRVDVSGLLKSSSRSAAALLASNIQLFGKGLLGHYQALSTSITKGFGRGAFPYGHSRHSWRNAIVDSILIAGSGLDTGSRMAAATGMQQGSAATGMQQGSATAGMQQRSTAGRGVMIDEQTLQAALASVPLTDDLQGEVGPRWTFRPPANIVTAPPGGAAAEAGRNKGGERRGRKKKSTGISINEGGRPRETGVSINEGGRSVGENRREGEGQGRGKEVAVQVASNKGKEKVAEGVQDKSRKGKERLPVIEEDDDDDDEDADLRMAMFLNWQEYNNSMSRQAQTSSSHQGPPPPLPPPPPPAAN